MVNGLQLLIKVTSTISNTQIKNLKLSLWNIAWKQVLQGFGCTAVYSDVGINLFDIYLTWFLTVWKKSST